MEKKYFVAGNQTICLNYVLNNHSPGGNWRHFMYLEWKNVFSFSRTVHNIVTIITITITWMMMTMTMTMTTMTMTMMTMTTSF